MQISKASENLIRLEKDKYVNIRFHYHNEDLLKSIDAFFSRLLAKYDMIYLLDYVVTIMRELIANAVKANAKRYYFKKLNIDINDPGKYADSIINFKKEILGTNTIERELEKTDYETVVTIELLSDAIQVSVVNNSSIHPVELERINLRINKAKLYNDFTDAYDEIYDETEGAGLGIVLTILLLKNTGMGENSFSISTDGKTTRAKYFIPNELRPKIITTSIKKQILDEVEGLPSFSQNILEVLRLCKDRKTEIKKIVDKIIVDPALTSDILKLSNSAGFFIGKRVEQITEAIIIIGLANLYDLVLVSSTRSLLERRYSKFHEIWAHCTKTANYSKYINQKFGKGKNTEYAYLSGLLHDLGKLILLATDSKFSEWISELTKNRKLRTSTVLEEVSLGISHSNIGELMAKKWNFPDYLVEAIKYHHSPLEAQEKYRDFIFPTYLANMLCEFETGKYNFYYLEETILEKYRLYSPNDVENLHKELKQNCNGKI